MSNLLINVDAIIDATNSIKRKSLN